MALLGKKRKRNKKIKRVILKELTTTFKGISILIFIGFMCFLYVYQNVCILRAGYRIENKQKKLDELNQKVLNLKVIIAKIESPSFIKKRIKQFGLHLKPCDEDNVVWVRKDDKEI